MFQGEEIKVYSISEINEYICYLLESDEHLQDVTIRGEISSFTRATSGHVYLSLKDGRSQLNCVMFRNYYDQCAADFRQGDMVMARGNFSVYLQRGSYQFQLTYLGKAGGQGDIYQRFLLMKDKLEKEGLFDDQRKRAIPYFPRKIGIATSAQGAVIHDMIKVFRRKCPHVEIVLAPTLVQGDTAPVDICRSITCLNQLPGLELIIIARGGGSFEELDCFNAEQVARAIAASPLPVISAIGHETDYTIADFVADYRAPTPTSAAEYCVPDASELQLWMNEASIAFQRNITRQSREMSMLLDDQEKQLIACAAKNIMAGKKDLLLAARQVHVQPLLRKFAEIQQQINLSIHNKIHLKREKLNIFEERLALLDLNKTLERGFSITLHGGRPLKTTNNLKAGQKIDTLLLNGKISSTIDKIDEK